MSWERHQRAGGFTLVELLVVITVIGILMAILVPAVQSVRESGRRAECSNKLHNLGVALSAFHEGKGTFPPAMTVPVAAGSDPAASTSWGVNWVISILPTLDQEPLYNSFNLNKPISDSANQVPRSARLPVMVCPSDTGQNVMYSGDGGNWARGCYGANGSIEVLDKDLNGRGSANWGKGYKRGVMGCNASVSLDQITDGASNTILLAELRSGVVGADRRGTWAMGACGASSLFGHGRSDDNGPNNPSDTADKLSECTSLYTAVGADANAGKAALANDGMGCGDGGGGTRQATARSRHRGGVFVCLCDGSVRFINDIIDKTPSNQTTVDNAWNKTTTDPTSSVLLRPDFRVWERLNASGDGLDIDFTSL
jgi:prepilin-type N-terminal cleavage/methylation domain-containing protein